MWFQFQFLASPCETISNHKTTNPPPSKDGRLEMNSHPSVDPPGGSSAGLSFIWPRWGSGFLFLRFLHYAFGKKRRFVAFIMCEDLGLTSFGGWILLQKFQVLADDMTLSFKFIRDFFYLYFYSSHLYVTGRSIA